MKQRAGQWLKADEISDLTDEVPVPVSVPPPNQRYPFPQMAAGDSFTIPMERRESMRSVLARFRRSFPERKFVWLPEGDRLRIWRSE
jgi:hypothetical protein